MKLASVKLNDGGIKGIIASYETTQTKGGRDYYNEHIEKKKSPVHNELQKAFKKLEYYFLEILSYPSDAIENLIKKRFVEITGITAGAENFLITGKIYSVVDNTSFTVNTPLIKAEMDYNHYAEVQEIVDEIYKESVDFIVGDKVKDDKQMMIDFKEKKMIAEDIDIDGMSPEDIAEFCQDFLEARGSVVLRSPNEEANDAAAIDHVEKFNKKRKSKKEKKEETIVDAIIENETPSVPAVTSEAESDFSFDFDDDETNSEEKVIPMVVSKQDILETAKKQSV